MKLIHRESFALEAIQFCVCVHLLGACGSRWSSIDLHLLLLISDYSDKALLYSIEQRHKHSEQVTVARRGQTARCVYSSVCDRGARTGINTKTHTGADIFIHNHAPTHTRNHIM